MIIPDPLRAQLDQLVEQYGVLTIRFAVCVPLRGCRDCGSHADGIYMLHHEVWAQAMPGWVGTLCLPCVERRLGRELSIDDFNDAPCNEPIKHMVAKYR